MPKGTIVGMVEVDPEDYPAGNQIYTNNPQTIPITPWKQRGQQGYRQVKVLEQIPQTMQGINNMELGPLNGRVEVHRIFV